MIGILSLVFLILLIIVGKERGIKTFITFYLSLFLIILYLTFINLGINAIILSIITCILASFISLFILNGFNKKTLSSFISIIFVLFFIYIVIYLISSYANIQGFSFESVETIGAYSFNINYKMKDVIIGMYLICAIGTIIDTSISISSSMNEINDNNKKINKKELYLSGMNVGNDILNTTINTLFFALVSSFIGFILWHKGYSIEYIINYKSFAQSAIELLIAFIGSILIIPITAYISSFVLKRK